MIGGIIGDLIGSRFVRKNTESKNFILFTERSMLTEASILLVATIQALCNDRDYKKYIKQQFHKQIQYKWSAKFFRWAIKDDQQAYHSEDNLAAVRTAPIGLFYNKEKDVLSEARLNASLSHDHQEAILASEAIALAVYLAKSDKTKKEIIKSLYDKFSLDISLDIQKGSNDSAVYTIQMALKAFYYAESFEDALRLAVSYGGDSGSITSMCGCISEAFYKDIPYKIIEDAIKKIALDTRWQLRSFYKRLLNDYDHEYIHFLIECLDIDDSSVNTIIDATKSEDHLIEVQRMLKKEFSLTSYNTWIDKLTVLKENNNSVVLVTESEFHKSILDNRYISYLEMAYRKVLNRDIDVFIEFNGSNVNIELYNLIDDISLLSNEQLDHLQVYISELNKNTE